MSRQQMRLYGSEKARTRVDELKAERFLRGQLELMDALELSDDAARDLRRQAIALHRSGKYDDCIDVVLGLAALGNVHPIDPLLLARCYTALGDPESARLCGEHHERMMRATGGAA